MKKILLIMPLALLLFACNNDDDYVLENEKVESIEPNSESEVLVDGDNDRIFCTNRWDCTKFAPKKNTVKKIDAVVSTNILNVK